jgi:hypothetical protein
MYCQLYMFEKKCKLKHSYLCILGNKPYCRNKYRVLVFECQSDSISLIWHKFNCLDAFCSVTNLTARYVLTTAAETNV